MNMKEWAKREVELACKRENPDGKEGEFDYGCGCYESALKAFNSLCDDGHSGFSIKMTQNILNQLIDGRPLTPIEDTDDIWERRECEWYENADYEVYQCNRMPSLFKYVYKNGNISYKDNDYVVIRNLDNPDVPYRNGFITEIIYQMFPITMPYIPTEKPFTVYVWDFLADAENDDGGYDTIEVTDGVNPNGEKFGIHRYFKVTEDCDYVEIDSGEFLERYEQSVATKKERKGE